MSNKEAVCKLITLLKEYKKIIASIFCCLLISTGLNLCIPRLSRRIVDEGVRGGHKIGLIVLV